MESDCNINGTNTDMSSGLSSFSELKCESIEDNRRQLIKSGLWGVPSFRLLDASQNEVFSSWGRDRIWLLTHEINNALIRN